MRSIFSRIASQNQQLLNDDRVCTFAATVFLLQSTRVRLEKKVVFSEEVLTPEIRNFLFHVPLPSKLINVCVWSKDSCIASDHGLTTQRPKYFALHK